MKEFVVVPDDDDEFDPGYPEFPDDPGDIHEREDHPEFLEEEDDDG